MLARGVIGWERGLFEGEGRIVERNVCQHKLLAVSSVMELVVEIDVLS